MSYRLIFGDSVKADELDDLMQRLGLARQGVANSGISVMRGFVDAQAKPGVNPVHRAEILHLSGMITVEQRNEEQTFSDVAFTALGCD